MRAAEPIPSTLRPLSWLGVARLGLAQAALGAVTVLTIAILNRVMKVELGLPATLPAALVVFQYAVQVMRPSFGFRSDVGGRRTPWIIGGAAVLSLGGVLAAAAVALMETRLDLGIGLAILAYLMIGLGIGAAGTTLLALLTARVAPERKPAAASVVWMMMIAGIVFTAVTAGSLLEPFSTERLIGVAAGIGAMAFLISCLAVIGMDRSMDRCMDPNAYRCANTGSKTSLEELTEERFKPESAAASSQSGGFSAALREIWRDGQARRFTYFVFISMLAYKGQDIILEPFAGEVFAYSVEASTKLSGFQNAGALLGMALVAVSGWLLGGHPRSALRYLTLTGCAGSAISLAALALTARHGIAEALQPAAVALGFCNGVFAVAAIATMMALAENGGGRASAPSREGTRIGVWGAAQGFAFGLGILAAAALVDTLQAAYGSAASGYAVVFGALSGLFVIAGVLAVRIEASAANAAPERRGDAFAARLSDNAPEASR